MGISQATYYLWKRKYTGVRVLVGAGISWSPLSSQSELRITTHWPTCITLRNSLPVSEIELHQPANSDCRVTLESLPENPLHRE